MTEIERPEPTVGPDRGRRALLAGAAGAAVAAGGGLLAAGAGPAGAQPPAGRYDPVAEPFRAYDSREDPEGKISLGEIYVVDLADVPDTAIAVVANLAVTGTQGQGFLTVYGQGIARPGVSTINWFASNQTLANMVTIATEDADKDLNVYCGGPATHFVVDVYGWFA